MGARGWLLGATLFAAANPAWGSEREERAALQAICDLPEAPPVEGLSTPTGHVDTLDRMHRRHWRKITARDEGEDHGQVRARFEERLRAHGLATCAFLEQGWLEHALSFADEYPDDEWQDAVLAQICAYDDPQGLGEALADPRVGALADYASSMPAGFTRDALILAFEEESPSIRDEVLLDYRIWLEGQAECPTHDAFYERYRQGPLADPSVKTDLQRLCSSGEYVELSRVERESWMNENFQNRWVREQIGEGRSAQRSLLMLLAEAGFESCPGIGWAPPPADAPPLEATGLHPVPLDLDRWSRRASWGYVDTMGEVRIPGPFEAAGRFREGLAAVQVEGRSGFLGADGQFAIEARFEEAESFSEGRAAVRTDGGWGYVDRRGREVIPTVHALVTPFAKGRAWVAIEEEGALRWSLVNRRGRVLAEPSIVEARAFAEGLAAVALESDEGVRWGFADRRGRLAIPARWDEVEDFSEGLAGVCERHEEVRQRHGRLFRCGYIDARGEEVIEARFRQAGPFAEGLAPAMSLHGHHGFVDREGTWAVKPHFREALRFAEGRAAVRDDAGAWGYVERGGGLVIFPYLHRAESFEDGVAMVSDFRRTILIDQHGRLLWRGHPTPSEFEVRDACSLSRECWETALRFCRNASFRSSLDSVRAVYLLDHERVGDCAVEQRFTRHDDPALVGPSQRCTLDRSLPFEEAFEQALNAAPDEPFRCEGELTDLLRAAGEVSP